MDNEPRQPLTLRQQRTFALGLAALGVLLALAAWLKPHGLYLAASVTLAAWAAAMLLRPGRWRTQLPAAIFPALLVGLAAAGVTAAVAVTVLAIVLAATTWRSVPFAQGFYDRWLLSAEPLGWTFSGLSLALAYYLVLTPIAIAMRLARRDSLRRRFEPNAQTYWTTRPAAPDAERYFRQY